MSAPLLALLAAMWTSFPGAGARLQDGPGGSGGPAGPGEGAPREPAVRGDRRWRALELPVGLTLDLATGQVVSRADRDEGTLVFADGVLRASPRLRTWPRPGAERTSARVVRGGGAPVDQPLAEEGREYLFELADGSWGYVRLVRVGEESVDLELVRAEAGRETLVRDPQRIETTTRQGSIELYWVGSRPGVRYEVSRSALGSSEPPVVLGVVDETLFVDHGVEAGVPVEYRIQPAGDPLAWGSTVRAVVSETPPEWPLVVERGSRIDLLSGEVDGQRAHLEVAYASESHLNLRPLEGALLARLSTGAPGTAPSWVLPSAESGEYQGKLLSVQVGEDVGVLLPGHVFARLGFAAGDPSGGGSGEATVALRRQLDLDGTRLLPVPPDARDLRWMGRGPVVGFGTLAKDVPDRDSVMVVVERELEYGSDTWEELFVGAPGERKLHFELPEAVLAASSVGRFRFRHAYPWGSRSLPGEPERVLFGDLQDPAQRMALVDMAMRELVDESYGRRMAARGVLEAVGPDAWPRLREALDSDDPELAGAAREILLASDAPRGDNIASVLLAQAQADGLGSAPDGWLVPEVDERAGAVLRSWDAARADGSVPEELAGWLRVLVRAEPDEGLRRLAVLLADQTQDARGAAHTGNRGRASTPFVLVPPAERPVPEAGDWEQLFRSEAASSAELAAATAAAIDLAHPRQALVLLQVARRAASAARTGGAEGDRSRADLELAARLAQRAEDELEAPLLEAAEQLVVAPRSRLDALRELVELRGGVSFAQAADAGRPRFEVPDATLGDLVAQIEALKLSGETYVDVVLPPGDYYPVDGENWIDVSVPGLRLIGGPGTKISVGLRAVSVEDVVVRGVEIDSEKTAAFTLMEAGVSLFDCELRGADTGIMVQRSTLELHGCDVRRRELSRRSSWSVRLSGVGSQVFARASILRAGSLLAGSGGFAYLESCVVDGMERPALQGQDRSRAILRDCLVRGESSGVQNFADLQLEGVVLAFPTKPLSHTGGRGWLCPEHVIFLDIDDPLGLPRDLAQCPFDEDR